MSILKDEFDFTKSKTRGQILAETIKSNCSKENSNVYFFDIFKKDTEIPIQLQIPDTLLFNNGYLAYWLKTNEDGFIFRNPIDTSYFNIAKLEKKTKRTSII